MGELITHERALDALRLDEDASTTGLVQGYIDAIPSWIEAVCGVPADEVKESEDGVLETLELFLVQLFHCPDGLDSDRLRVTIDSLTSIVKARRIAEEESNG